MIASLPMYDLPGLEPATDAWWAGLARHLRSEGFAGAPDRLTRPTGSLVEHWNDPALLLSQTCGYPYTHALAGRVSLVATPAYDVDGCGADGSYRSLVVVPRDSGFYRLADLRGARAVCNALESMSGRLALEVLVAPLGGRAFFGSLAWSGGHRASLAMLRGGEADVAAIDCVTFALAARLDPSLAGAVREIARGPQAPGLPYITAAGRSPGELARLRRAVMAAAADPVLAAPRAALAIAGIAFPGHDAYLRIVELEAAAAAAGHPALA